MASNIDVTLPVARHPSTVTERANWQAAHDEITALQEAVESIGTSQPSASSFDWLAATPSYANDSAAAAGGVPIRNLYRNGSQVMIRMA